MPVQRVVHLTNGGGGSTSRAEAYSDGICGEAGTEEEKDVVVSVNSRGSSVADLVEEGPADFRVHSSVYTDQGVFEQEIHTIFENGWVYVAHESEIASPGDYVTRRIGTQPVIVTRGAKEQINVLLNVCRHRANAICREQQGSNTFSFRCPYHSWTYANTGELLGVADRTRYPKGFGSDLNLLKAAKTGSYQGLIFASLNADVPDLDDHLAGIKHQIDYWADRSLEGSNTLLLPHRYGYSGNWKFQAENGVDGYHASFVHESAFDSFAKGGVFRYLNRPSIKTDGTTRGFPGGHSTLEGGYAEGRGSARSLPEMFEDYMSKLRERHGEERAREVVSARHLFIFPNVYLFDDLVRIVQPISLEETEIYSHPFRLGGVPEEFNARRLYEVTRQLSTTGMVNPADLEMFAANQTGLHADMDWLELCRGIEMEEVRPSGERVGQHSDETPQRAFYRAWQQVMSQSSFDGC